MSEKDRIEDIDSIQHKLKLADADMNNINLLCINAIKDYSVYKLFGTICHTKVFITTKHRFII